MEHRALTLPHPPAIHRYLTEADSSPFERILAAGISDREQYYINSHHSQLRTVQPDIFSRGKRQLNRYPFLCAFHFAGCDQTFETKREWKDHVVSQHLKFSRVFWECVQGDCMSRCIPLEIVTKVVESKTPPGTKLRSNVAYHLPEVTEDYKPPWGIHPDHHQIRIKPRLSKQEVEILEAEFQKNQKPSSTTKKALANSMSINNARINNWFQNRRAREKQKKNTQKSMSKQTSDNEEAADKADVHSYDKRDPNALFSALQSLNMRSLNAPDLEHESEKNAQSSQMQNPSKGSPLNEIYCGRLFTNKYDFCTHTVDRHRPTAFQNTDRDIVPSSEEVRWLLDRQDSSLRMTPSLPHELGCPMPQCASVRFWDPTAWDQRLNHAAEHFLAIPQCSGVFGGERDWEFVQWASSERVGIIQKASDNRLFLSQNSDRSVANSGYGGMPGNDIPQHTNVSERGDTSTASVIMPKQSNKTFASPNKPRKANVDAIPEKPSCPEGLIPDDLSEQDGDSSVYPSSQAIFSPPKSMEDQETSITLNDLSVASPRRGSQGMLDNNTEIALIMEWFHRWLRDWLALLTREKPVGHGSSQTTTSTSVPATQSQNSNSNSNSSAKAQKEKGTSRSLHTPKRKRDNDEEDGNEETPKPQRSLEGIEILRLACPYFKRRPRKYGQPKWKACAHPGYKDVHRVKEHMYRNHSSPDHQCRRCSRVFTTSKDLDDHSLQVQACTPRTTAQDALSRDQITELKSKKGRGKNKTEVERWKEVYAIAFPNDREIPSPYLCDIEQDKHAREFNLCQEFCHFMEMQLPLRVEKHLTKARCPLPEKIKDDILQLVKQIVPELQSSFLKEKGYVTGDDGEQPQNGSTTHPGTILMGSSSTETSFDSEELAAMYQESASEEPVATLTDESPFKQSISMCFASDDRGELTMPLVGDVPTGSTIPSNGDFSNHGIVLPPTPLHLRSTIEGLTWMYQDIGVDPRLTLSFGGIDRPFC